MLLEVDSGRKVLAQFPDATAVFVVGDFNGWCTASTPMRVGASGLWEVELPPGVELGRYAFWVWEAGHVGGRLCWRDRAAA